MDDENGLELVEDDGQIVVMDRAVGSWLVRIEPIDTLTSESTKSIAGAAVLRSLAEAVPGLSMKLPAGGRASSLPRSAMAWHVVRTA